MVRIDWSALLSRYHIDYRTSGKDVQKGNVNIACPMCGDDPGHHMGLKDNGWWACWRNAGHRGKNPVVILSIILGCSKQEARSLLNINDVSFLEGDMDELLKFARDSVVKEEEKVLQMPESFERVKLSTYFWDYLESRGFIRIKHLVLRYKLKQCRIGKYQQRIIIPVFLNGKLVNWTGRDITNTSVLRYKACSNEDAVMPITDTLLNYDSLIKKSTRNKCLVITEGPMDALKLDYYGAKFGMRSTCLFTKTITERQSYLLEILIRNFPRVVIMLDVEGASTADYLRISMHGVKDFSKVENVQVPAGASDPGELTYRQVERLARYLCRDL